jgi:hypothetical protein
MSPDPVRNPVQALGSRGVTALELLRQRARLSSVSRASAARTFVARGMILVTALALLPGETDEIAVGVDELKFGIAARARCCRAVPEKFRVALSDIVAVAAEA